MIYFVRRLRLLTKRGSCCPRGRSFKLNTQRHEKLGLSCSQNNTATNFLISELISSTLCLWEYYRIILNEYLVFSSLYKSGNAFVLYSLFKLLSENYSVRVQNYLGTLERVTLNSDIQKIHRFAILTHSLVGKE